MKCRWEGCQNDGTKDQLDRSGIIWSLLCDEHDKRLEEAIKSLNPKRLVAAWIKAQGGAKAAAARM